MASEDVIPIHVVYNKLLQPRLIELVEYLIDLEEERFRFILTRMIGIRKVIYVVPLRS